jgi:hypothetical protein
MITRKQNRFHVCITRDDHTESATWMFFGIFLQVHLQDRGKVLGTSHFSIHASKALISIGSVPFASTILNCLQKMKP